MSNGTSIGKAYVQIVPSAQGISGAISKVIGGEADSAGKSAGSTIASGIKSGLAAAAGVVTAAAGAAATAVGVFAKQAIDTGSQFDSSMSQVAATLGLSVQDITDNVNGAGDTFDALRAKAQEMGAATNFSASEAAEGLNILAMSGYDADQSIEMIEDVLHLAAAGAMDMASAAGYVSGAMKGFNDETKDSGYYADLMAKGATLANTSVSQLGEAISSGAAGAAAYSQDAESMTLALLRLAEQGEVGSAAGTALAAAMKNLYTPTNQAKDVLEELGVAAYDSAGNARGFNDVVNELDAALAGYTEEQQAAYKQTIFGIQGLDAYNKMTVTGVEKQEEWAAALAGASVNLEEVTGALEATGIAIGNTYVGFADLADEMVWNFQRLGGDAEAFSDEMRDYLHFEYDISYDDAEKAIQEFVAVMETQTGEAAKQYGTMTDNLQGDIDIWNSALDGFRIAIADQLMPTIREFVQFGSDGISKITAAFQEGGLSGAMEAAGEVLSGLLNKVIEMLPEMVDAGMQLLGAVGQGLLDNLPMIIDAAVDIITTLVSGIVQALPALADGAMQIILGLANGIIEMLPELIPAIVEVVLQITETLIDNIDLLIDASIALITGLAEGLIDALPILIEKAPVIVEKLVTAIISNVPKLIEASVQIIVMLVTGIVQNFPRLVKAALEIVGTLVAGIISFRGKMLESAGSIMDTFKDGIMSFVHDAANWGHDLIDNFVSGITGAIGKVRDAVSNVADTVKGFLGFSEPEMGPLSDFHTFAPDMLALFAEGIRNGESEVVDSVSHLGGMVADTLAESVHHPAAGIAADAVASGIPAGNVGGNKVDMGGVTIQVYAAQGQDEQMIAEQLSRILEHQVYRAEAVFA